jgi:flagellar motor component MotA
MDINSTLKTILEICGALAVLGGGIKAVAYMTNPFRSIKDKLTRHEQLFAHDKQAIEKLDERVTALGLAVSEIINHELTGNDIEALKQRQRELNSKFIK